ncbi:unnamed protein product [Linum tenue]|uniref:NAC domain-containing protein n=1 Tax=Linum tenue TaxID=586396 RepID=A0AAV0LV84_9ROSI|nr:unnamed protein product [Linum tenue]
MSRDEDKSGEAAGGGGSNNSSSSTGGGSKELAVVAVVDDDDHEHDMVMPGFRFHPTEEELVEFYLRRKVEGKRFNVDLITSLDLYRYDPWQLPVAMAAIGEKEWFFYVPRDRKYRNGDRPNRVTASGYWKATGADRMIRTEGLGRSIGLKKTLVFYSGKAPKGVRSSWIMNEYRLPHHDTQRYHKTTEISLCRVYKRPGVEDHHAGGPSLPRSLPSTMTPRQHHHHHHQNHRQQHPQLQQPSSQVLMEVDKLTSSSSSAAAASLHHHHHHEPPPPNEVVDEQFLILSGGGGSDSNNNNNNNINNNSNAGVISSLDDLHRLVNFQQHHQQQYYTSLLQQQQQQMMFLPPHQQQQQMGVNQILLPTPSFSNGRSPLQIWEWNDNVVSVPQRAGDQDDHQANDNDNIKWD